MSHTLDISLLPSQAKNNPNKEVVFSNTKFTLLYVESTNDNGVKRTKTVLDRNTHGKAPVDVVLVNAHFRVDGEEYLVLTRQWREATGAYSVAFPAGTYGEGDRDAIKAGIRELAEETPFTAIKGDLSIPAFSSDGCLSETFQILEVRAKPKPDTSIMNGIAWGATTQTSGESIVTLYVPMNTLYTTLSMLEKSHHSIDGRLMVYALGYENARRDARRRLQNTFQAIFTAFAFSLVLFAWLFLGSADKP